MAVSMVPRNGITLKSYGEHANKGQAILLKLDDGAVQDIRKAAEVKNGFQFLTGTTPKFRIGGRTIDLTLSSEAFRNELYNTPLADSLAELEYAGLITHRAALKVRQASPKVGETGTDEALAALQRNMASFEQEKQANQIDIHNVVLPEPKNRFAAAKKQHRRMLSSEQGLGASSQVSTPMHNAGPTSAYTSEADVRTKAMRIPLIHLLAMRPLASEAIVDKTHMPSSELDSILPKVARKVDGTWQLMDRAYKDLEVWKFGYTSQEDQKLAIGNAIRAYDRLRIGKEDKIWQGLLAKEERGKGIILSRLNPVNRGLTPLHGQDLADDNMSVSAAVTPPLGASTPRPGGAKSDPMKRIMAAKDPKKRAIEEAKEKKRKEKEKEVGKDATGSDREGAKRVKAQPKKKADPKIKSAETVHSSDEESGEEGEVKEGANMSRVDSKIGPEKANQKSNPRASASPEESDAAGARRAGTPSTKKLDPAKSIAALANKTAKAAAGKSTPRTTTGLSAPSSQHKSARSPSKTDSRPNVPSPLGAARPRVASDVSDRHALGVQRLRPGAATPQGLGITNGGIRKRHGTITSTDSAASSASDKKATEMQRPKPSTNGSHKATPNGIRTPQPTNGVKRKVADTASTEQSTKHRRTVPSTPLPTSSRPAESQAHPPTTSQTSPKDTTGESSDSATSIVLDSITYSQGVAMAEKFRDHYYPAYATMYDALAAKEAGGEVVEKGERETLWAMHKRLEQMKREIAKAAAREDGL
ncbi:hypothetical protein LTR78_005930 [Recurvomyces mirabilis]|uniref:RNA polymerase II elongation factor ELL N-terminal domain-containing protein n=1 Tax=Recurvomyces mirabilis TaxID=574656 RepID=A0AAE0WLU3_9PEZI|nr:hypothetical protein LTR78_005930 [Recurvomyces mirabilis]KAK5155260.1 hypothetical protein LTS14_006215 [Recurvomyces mirabilis]